MGEHISPQFANRMDGLDRRTNARLLCDGAPAGGDTASQQADLVQWGFLVDCDNRHVRKNSVLRECRDTHLTSSSRQTIG